jgi:hypothetical protein
LLAPNSAEPVRTTPVPLPFKSKPLPQSLPDFTGMSIAAPAAALVKLALGGRLAHYP